MTGKKIVCRVRKRFLRSSSIGVLFLVLAAVGGCSSVPDAVNPAEWYKSAKNVFSGDDSAAQPAQDANGDTSGLVAERGKPAPGADKPYPNLSSVPEGLAADNRKRKYASDAVRFQGKAEQSLSDEKKTVVASSAPPPPTIPSTPVTSAPLAKPELPAPAVSQVAPMVNAPASPTLAQSPKRAPRISVSNMSSHSEGLSEFAPATSGSVEETFQARISQSRPARVEPAGSDLVVAQAPSSASLPAGPQEFETVVISSDGLTNERLSPDRPDTTVSEVAAAPPPAPVATRLSASGKEPLKGSIKVATIQFSNGSATIDDPSRRVLVDVSRLLRNGGGKIRVLGYASSRTRSMDPIRHKMVNYRISVDRADRVAQELIRLGVPAEDVMVDARSDSAPIYYEFMPSGEAGNRRAEIFIER